MTRTRRSSGLAQLVQSSGDGHRNKYGVGIVKQGLQVVSLTQLTLDGLDWPPGVNGVMGEYWDKRMRKS